VASIMVVVVSEFGEHGSQVALIDHDHVIKTFRSHRPHNPLADGVRLWRPRRRPHPRDAEIGQIGQPLESRVKLGSTFALPQLMLSVER
jgi:hypothetical protein